MILDVGRIINRSEDVEMQLEGTLQHGSFDQRRIAIVIARRARSTCNYDLNKSINQLVIKTNEIDNDSGIVGLKWLD